MAETKTWAITGVTLVVLIVVTSAVFLSNPQLDIRFSELFTDQNKSFYLRPDPVLDDLRFFFMYGVNLVAALCLVLLIWSVLIGKRRQVSLRIWGFMVTSFILAPGLLVNGILKSYWGRARPADIEYFGGTAEFSPPLLISDQCASNCSFVSGEGSGITTAVLVLALVLWPNLNRFWRGVGIFLILPFATVGISLRIATGRHFLSDTLFAVLFCALVIWALYRVFDIARHSKSLTWANMRKDLLKR